MPDPRFRFKDIGVLDGTLTDGSYETSIETPWGKPQRIGEVFLGQKWTPQDDERMKAEGAPRNPFQLKRHDEWGWHAIHLDGAFEGPFRVRKEAAQALLDKAPPHIKTLT